MVVDWEQETGLLMSSGDVRIVRIWDTDREMKVQVTATPHQAPQLCSPHQTGLVREKQESGSHQGGSVRPPHRRKLITSRCSFIVTL